MGIDIDNDFAPTYIVSDDKSKVVKNLKKAIKGVGKIFLATDPDREGEAIAWHIYELLKKLCLNQLMMVLQHQHQKLQHQNNQL